MYNNEKQNSLRPTCTFGAGNEWWSWFACTPLPWSGEQHSDLVLCVRVKMPQLIVGGIDGVRLCPAAWRHTVLNLKAESKNEKVISACATFKYLIIQFWFYWSIPVKSSQMCKT